MHISHQRIVIKCWRAFQDRKHAYHVIHLCFGGICRLLMFSFYIPGFHFLRFLKKNIHYVKVPAVLIPKERKYKLKNDNKRSPRIGKKKKKKKGRTDDSNPHLLRDPKPLAGKMPKVCVRLNQCRQPAEFFHLTLMYMERRCPQGPANNNPPAWQITCDKTQERETQWERARERDDLFWSIIDCRFDRTLVHGCLVWGQLL